MKLKAISIAIALAVPALATQAFAANTSSALLKTSSNVAIQSIDQKLPTDATTQTLTQGEHQMVIQYQSQYQNSNHSQMIRSVPMQISFNATGGEQLLLKAKQPNSLVQAQQAKYAPQFELVNQATGASVPFNIQKAGATTLKQSTLTPASDVLLLGQNGQAVTQQGITPIKAGQNKVTVQYYSSDLQDNFYAKSKPMTIVFNANQGEQISIQAIAPSVTTTNADVNQVMSSTQTNPQFKLVDQATGQSVSFTQAPAQPLTERANTLILPSQVKLVELNGKAVQGSPSFETLTPGNNYLKVTYQGDYRTANNDQVIQSQPVNLSFDLKDGQTIKVSTRNPQNPTEAKQFVKNPPLTLGVIHTTNSTAAS
ncbi:DUF2057 family protein [Dongshaea marina]|uniref:DUF2057 family protein n=1 Tax=Dongshaea marina TaxID=2047966 RepID=UPI000D3ED415|nr:DUF2057 family protein [Dongshaea marina]